MVLLSQAVAILSISTSLPLRSFTRKATSGSTMQQLMTCSTLCPWGFLPPYSTYCTPCLNCGSLINVQFAHPWRLHFLRPHYVWTCDSCVSVLQHVDMIACHSTPTTKIKLHIKGSCIQSTLLYMRKINTVYSIT